jgi:methyl-accepting chemotaxis protein
MANVEEIDKAIGAHGLWKTRLKTAIDSGKSEMPVETIREDNQCAFGKWLYGPSLTSADKASSHYKTVKDLHAEFHKTAAHVTELAVSGKKADAQSMMSLNGAYAAVSGKLTQAMLEWKTLSK